MSPTYAWWIYHPHHHFHGMVDEPTLTAALERISRRNTVPACAWKYADHALIGTGPSGATRVRITEAFSPKRKRRKAKGA